MQSLNALDLLKKSKSDPPISFGCPILDGYVGGIHPYLVTEFAGEAGNIE